MKTENQSNPGVSQRSLVLRQEGQKGFAGISIIPHANLEGFVGTYTGG